ncbi:MAG: D-glucuronyl C5-epimerase family protein [Lachnospiraceae bacterium]|nr:D-glucuronyl C5-epimerase family protein [Lachnospiraceae bacterium]
MLSSSLLKKWRNMLKNESVFHVNQAEGKYYSVTKLKGYYNDLSEKVLYTTKIDECGIPYNIAALGKRQRKVYFAISIFQYGLGAYDLFLEHKDKVYLQKMLLMADWAINNQNEDGSWNTFGVLCYHCPFSSMAQGEGASLLARAYTETKNDLFRIACIKAIDFMLKSVIDGGTTLVTPDGIVLMEYPEKDIVLNGWIFSAFGLLDCWKITGEEKYRKAWNSTLNVIKKSIKRFDTGHWSYYDESGKYASPFYHGLHIELLCALNKLSPDVVFEKYIRKWKKYKDNKFWSTVAFLVKAKQKVCEKQSKEWIIVS